MQRLLRVGRRFGRRRVPGARQGCVSITGNGDVDFWGGALYVRTVGRRVE
jgi:hypothetical protein